MSRYSILLLALFTSQLFGQSTTHVPGDAQTNLTDFDNDLIIVRIHEDGMTAGLAINPAYKAQTLQAPVCPTLRQLLRIADTTGILFTGGSPPTRLDAGQFISFNDSSLFDLRVANFNFSQGPVQSSFDLGLGDIIDFSLQFAPYFAAHPDVIFAVAWHTSGANPSLSASTTTTDSLPRTLFPVNTLGDSVPIDTIILGTPDLDDGIVGWSVSGIVATADLPVDCNDNSVADDCDIAGGTSDDCNLDGRPDECVPLNDMEDAKLTAAEGASGDEFGQSVSVSGDTAVVGSARDDCAAGIDCGAAYVYRFDGTNWIEEQKLTASDAAEGDLFGWSVSLRGDTAIVGTLFADCAAGSNCGAAYVYRFDGTNWIEEQKLTASDAASFADFGVSVSLSGDTAIVGALLDACAGAGSGCGAAYVYRFDGTNWIEEQKLTASDAARFDQFGVSVSISGDMAIVGARGDDCAAGPNICGAAYVYQFNGTNWIEEQKLTASDAAGGDQFGHSVSFIGDTAVVGSTRDECAAGSNCGAAYVYRFDGTNWIEEQKLTASEAAEGDQFGHSVSISGNTVVVGSIFADCAAGFNCGAAYVYRFNGTNWIEQQKLTASDAVSIDEFGWSVSLSGDTAIVGTIFADCAAGSNCGAAYVYTLVDQDLDDDGILDFREDCNLNGVGDLCDLAEGASQDCNSSLVIDECDIARGDSVDCNVNGVPDECDLVDSTALSQWASYVIDFSTEYTNTDWSAAQALGIPDTFSYGDIATAWAPLSQNGTLESITVGYPKAMFVTGATVRETYGNGMIYQVDVVDTTDVLHTVWTGIDPSLPGSPVDFLITWPMTAFLVKGIKVYTDTDLDPDAREEIDAIQLHGMRSSSDCNSNTVPDECESDLVGDWNNDQIIGLTDHWFLIDCLSGPGASPVVRQCFDLCLAAFDLNHDGDVDLVDWASLQSSFTGP